MSDDAAGFAQMNISPDRSGLPGLVVFLTHCGTGAMCVHVARAPRVLSQPLVRLSVIDPAPDEPHEGLDLLEVDRVRQWVALNEETIRRCWTGDIAFSDDVLDAIRPLE